MVLCIASRRIRQVLWTRRSDYAAILLAVSRHRHRKCLYGYWLCYSWSYRSAHWPKMDYCRVHRDSFGRHGNTKCYPELLGRHGRKNGECYFNGKLFLETQFDVRKGINIKSSHDVSFNCNTNTNLRASKQMSFQFSWLSWPLLPFAALSSTFTSSGK